MLLANLFFFYQTKKQKLVDIESILSSLPVFQLVSESNKYFGFILYNDESIITYISASLIETGFRKYLGNRLAAFKLDFHDDKVKNFTLNKIVYEVTHYKGTKLLYFRNITEISDLNAYIQTKEQAILYYTFSVSNKISSEVLRLKLTVLVKEFFSERAEKLGGIFSQSTQTTQNANFIISDWIKLKPMLEANVDEIIFQKLKAKLEKNYDDISISIGISHGNIEQKKMYDLAIQAAKLAKTRGGNQVVLQSTTGEFKYYGKSSLALENKSLEELRFYYTHLVKTVTKFKEIFITSHANADFDALGSAFGLMKFLEELGVKVYIVLPELDNTANEAFQWISETEKINFVTKEQAQKLLTRVSALFIVDTTDLENVQASNLFDEISVSQVFIIDHHRIGELIIKKNNLKFDSSNVNFYIDPTTSSTAQIVTELSSFHHQTKKQLFSPTTATQLLGGIYLDTNQIQKNVSARTFDAISLLLLNGADKERVENLFKLDLEKSILLWNYVKYLRHYDKKTLLLFLPERHRFSSEDISIMCNQLLNYKNVNAAFVLGKINKNAYKLSARSDKNINVQLISEKLGGGGHFNVAAVYWNSSSITYQQIQKDIKNQIRKYKI